MFQANAIFICNALQILGSGAFLQSEASENLSPSQGYRQTSWGRDGALTLTMRTVLPKLES